MKKIAHNLAIMFWSSETAVMTALALLVGAGAGLGIAIFRRTLDGLFSLTIDGIAKQYAIGLFLFPALGGVLVALWMLLLRREHETGLGVAGIMEAVSLHGGRVGWRGSLARIVGAVLTVGLGGSAGPEDPSVQIGAVLGSQLGQRLKLSETRVKTLVGCGAAAGIGAAFNAPISGVFFAIEIIVGEFSGAAVGLVVLSAVAGAIVIQSLLGSRPAFVVPTYQLFNPLEFVLYAALGLAAAVVAFLYIRFIDRFETVFEDLHISRLAKPALGGLLVGVLAFFVRPEILGTGYPAIGGVLQGEIKAPLILFMLVGLKLIATPLTIGSGGQGGLFAPSLFLGAMLGVGFGLVAQMFFPGSIAPAGAYGLVGMGAVLAGAVRAPITAILLPFELTQDYHIVLPLMLATVISTIIARFLEPESVYTLKQKRLGIDLRAGKDVNMMRTISVADAMTPYSEMTPVKPTTSLGELARLFQATSHHGFVVVDRDADLYGMVTLSDLERALDAGGTAATVADICTRNVLIAFTDETLDDAMRHFAALDVGRIPVVERRSPTHVVGVLRRGDIIHAYSHALAQRQAQAERIERVRLESAVGTEIVEMDLARGDAAAGHYLKEIALPHDAVIISIRRRGRVIIPRGDTRLQAGDRVIALTFPAGVEELQKAVRGDQRGADDAD
ncbi:MAG: chloride channel protein [Rudaea sp.]